MTPSQTIRLVLLAAWAWLGIAEGLNGWQDAAPALLAWAVLLTVTGGMAPVVWGGTPLWQGILAGGVTALVAALVCWGAFAGERAWQKNQPRN
jgi:hypothetical protein